MITLHSQDLLANAASLRQMGQEMEQEFQTIRTRVRSLSASWNSPASQAFLQQFETLTPVFTSYCETVQSYIHYLEQTAQTYEQADEQLRHGFA